MSILRQITQWAAQSFSFVAGIVLVVCGSLELIESAGHSQLLSAPDPVTGVKFHSLMWAAGLVQVGGGMFAFLRVRLSIRLGAIGWMGAIFLSYRYMLEKVNPGGFCPCLGSLVNLFSMSKATVSSMAGSIAWTLFIGSSSLLMATLLLSAGGGMESSEVAVKAPNTQPRVSR